MRSKMEGRLFFSLLYVSLLLSLLLMLFLFGIVLLFWEFKVALVVWLVLLRGEGWPAARSTGEWWKDLHESILGGKG